MKQFKTVDFTVHTEGLDAQIAEVHNSSLTRVDKRKALVELGLTDIDLRIIYNGIYFNPHAPIRVVTPSGNKLTFGVEIECFVPRRRIEQTTAANGVRIEYESYNHSDQKDYFKFVTDSSVRSSNSEEEANAIECVTPVLKGTGGLSSLKSCCKSLNQAGAKVNRTCGLHVHVGMDEGWGEAYVNVFRNYQKLEGVIDSFMSPSRRSNSYCMGLSGFDFSQCHNYVEVLAVLRHDRYRKVNPCAYVRHRTIEFRQHQGTTNFTKISMWVKFCVKLVEWSKTHSLDHEVSSVDEIPFLSAKEKTYFKKRVEEFSVIS